MTREDKLELIRRCRDLLNRPDDFSQKCPRAVGVQVDGDLAIIDCDFANDADHLVMRVYWKEVRDCIGTIETAFDEHNARRGWKDEPAMERVLAGVRKVMVLDDLAGV